MNRLFWTGELSWPLKLLVNTNCLISLLVKGIKHAGECNRVIDGYNGSTTDGVNRYDEVGFTHYDDIARRLLDLANLSQEKIILDVGCGTGILSERLTGRCHRIFCLDPSVRMISECRERLADKAVYINGTADKIPYPDGYFDAVLSSMVLGMLPNQKLATKEMLRVLRPGGTIAVATHGPGHYKEGIEACLKSSGKLPLIGYRFEFWPLDINGLQKIFLSSAPGISHLKISRDIRQEYFKDGDKAFEFFEATSGLWWLERYSPDSRTLEKERLKKRFMDNIRMLTSDVVYAAGIKNI